MQDSNFYKRVLEQAQLAHKSINQVERDLGYPRNSLHNYKAGAEPSGSRLIEISNYFGVQPEYLMGFIKNQDMFPIKSIFKALNSNQKKEMALLYHKWLVSQEGLISVKSIFQTLNTDQKKEMTLLCQEWLISQVKI